MIKKPIRYWFAMLCLYGVAKLLQDNCSNKCADAMETIFVEIKNEMARLGFRVEA